jgi:hypothetical protein
MEGVVFLFVYQFASLMYHFNFIVVFLSCCMCHIRNPFLITVSPLLTRHILLT